VKVIYIYGIFGIRIPNYRLNRTAGDWDDTYDYTHLKVAKKLGVKVSDKVIFEKNETEKSVYL